MHELKKFTFTHYYGESGSLISFRSDRPRAEGTRRISADDHLCISVNASDDVCRGVVQVDGLIRKFVRKANGQLKIVVTIKGFRVRRGEESKSAIGGILSASRSSRQPAK